ncbi:unnamed protein product [Anisakis simplex]|uniref:Peroxisomal acyl-coenzyme A oxidase 3 (inferred by orthology to a human protein) n=1 Tax=Anisakis simplex TaxID=6269 RepID=A0A0M3KBB0_ANISI|nr:unnamed protein product [Anisakis simplex]
MMVRKTKLIEGCFNKTIKVPRLQQLISGGYCEGSEWGQRIQDGLCEAESLLKPNAIAICDAIAYPDFVQHSLLGTSDGRCYEHLLEYFQQQQHTTTSSKPKWCMDLSDFLNRK